MDSRGQCSVDERISDVAYELTRKCGINHLRKLKVNLCTSHGYHSAPEFSLWCSSSSEDEFSQSRSLARYKSSHLARRFRDTAERQCGEVQSQRTDILARILYFALLRSISAPHLKGGYNLNMKSQQSDPLPKPKEIVPWSKRQPNDAQTVDVQAGAQRASTPGPPPPYVPRYSEFRHQPRYQPPKYEWPTRNTIFQGPLSNERKSYPSVSSQDCRMPVPSYHGDRFPDEQGNLPSQLSNFASDSVFADSPSPFQHGGWQSDYYPGTHRNRETITNDGQDSNMCRESTVDFSVPQPLYQTSNMRPSDQRHIQPPIHGYPLNPTNVAQNFAQPSDVNGPGQDLQNEPFGVGAGPANNTGYVMPVNYYPGNSNTPTMPMHENQGVRYAYPGLLSNGSDAQQNPYRQASMGHNIPYPAPGHYRQYAPMGRNTSSPGMGYYGKVPGVAYGYQPAQPTISYGNTQSNMTRYPTPPPNLPQNEMQYSELIGFLRYPVYTTSTAGSDQVAEGQSAGQYSNYGDPNAQPAGNEQLLQNQELPTGGGPVQYTAPIGAQQLYYPARPISHPVHGMGSSYPCHGTPTPVSTLLAAPMNNGNPSANEVRMITKEQWESYGRATGNLPTAHPVANRNHAVDNGARSQPAQENALPAAPQLAQSSEGAQGLQEYRPDEANPRRLKIWEPTRAECEALGCVKLDGSARKYIPLANVNPGRTEVDDLLQNVYDCLDKLDMTDHLDKEKEKE